MTDSRAARAATAGWALVAMLWVVAMLNYLDRQVIFSLFPPLQKEFAVTSARLGLIGTVFLWVYGLASPLGGYLADRYSRRSLIIASLLVWSLVTWATGRVTGFNQLLGARALMGVSEALYLPAALAMIADRHGERTRSLATGLHQSGIYVGLILGGWLGGWMGEHYGWRPVFTLLGAAGIGYGAILFFGLKEAAPGPRVAGSGGIRFFDAMRDLGSRPAFLVLGAAATLSSIAGWIALTWLPLFLYERFGMSLAKSGFSATFYIQAAAFAGILLGGWLADVGSRTRPNVRVLIPCVGFLLGAVGLFLAGRTSLEWVLSLSLILYGLCRGFLDCNLMPILCRIAPADLRATGYGLFNMAGTLAGGAMTFAAGALKETVGLGVALQLSALLLVLAALLLSTIRGAAIEGDRDRISA